jgi:hypothetical protein
MSAGRPFPHLAFLLPLLALLACGDGTSLPSTATSPILQAPQGVQINGNVVGDVTGHSILVFALPEGITGKNEPLSVGVVDQSGEFLLSGLPAEPVVLVFLDDSASDGAIDEDDPVAVLGDETLIHADDSLKDLHDGDRVSLGDIELDFEAKRASAANVEVQQAEVGAGETAAQPTPTPAP